MVKLLYEQKLLNFIIMNKKIKNVLSYMMDKYTFIDMLCGGDFTGLETFGVAEGNGIIGISGEKLKFQCMTVSRGTRRELQLRSYDGRNVNVDERITIGDLFPGKEVIILTGGDSIRGFAPVFDDKLDLALWLRDLREWKESLEEPFAATCMVEDMIKMAKFLYRNNPDKKASIVDEI